MSYFSLTAITTSGINIIAKIVAGQTLEFDHVEVGDGALGGENPQNKTALTNKIMDVPITGVSATDGTALVRGTFSNEGLQTGFFYRELGLFAKDPQTGNVVLYAYANAEENAEYIPPAGSETIIEKIINLNTIIGNATKVSAVLKSGIYLTAEDVAAKINDHNKDSAAHAVLFAATNYYVATTGSDSNPGTEDKPFKTIQKAVDSIPQGSCKIDINIAAGTYAETVLVYNKTNSIIRFIGADKTTTNVESIQARESGIVSVSKITFNTAGSISLLFHNTKGRVYDSIINGSANTTGVYAYGSDTDVEETAINNCLRATYNDRGFIHCQKIRGTGNTYAYVAAGITLVGNQCTLTGTNQKLITSSGQVIEQATANSLTAGVADSTTDETDASKKIVTAEFLKKANGWAFPSNNFIDLKSQFSNNARFVAPANGFYMMRARTANAQNTLEFVVYADSTNDNMVMNTRSSFNVTNSAMSVYVPVSKGQNVVLGLAYVNVEQFKFIYALGEV